MSTVTSQDSSNSLSINTKSNVVTVDNRCNTVALNSITTTVSPVVKINTVTLDNSGVSVEVVTNSITLAVSTTLVSVAIQSPVVSVIAIGSQGPQGIQGPSGNEGTGDEISVLNKAEQKDTIEDSPSVGDITVYYGIASPQTATSAASWLITKQVFLQDGGVFDSSKKFASTTENQVWDNRISLMYL